MFGVASKSKGDDGFPRNVLEAPYIVGFDPATCPTDSTESYRLVSDDGSYDQTVGRADAKKSGSLLLLRFPMAPGGKKYSLFQVPSEGAQVLIFSDLTADGSAP